MIMNPRVSDVFRTRARVIEGVRSFLNQRGFLEVETPMMNMIPGGATAQPFITHHNDLEPRPVHARGARALPEDARGRRPRPRLRDRPAVFRNEGIDMTHNPEFTTCEFYRAYADYHDLMDMTEQLLSGDGVQDITRRAQGHAATPRAPTGPRNEVDFTPPFRRISMMLRPRGARSSVKLPADLDSEAAAGCSWRTSASQAQRRLLAAPDNGEAARQAGGRVPRVAVRQPHLHLRPPADHVAARQEAPRARRADGALRALRQPPRDVQRLHRAQRPRRAARALPAAGQGQGRRRRRGHVRRRGLLHGARVRPPAHRPAGAWASIGSPCC